jgi:H+-translocating NAD(P) transhydrogenase subunit alpha
MLVGIPKETLPGERRVAISPTVVAALAKKGFPLILQAGAGSEAGFPDADYEAKGAVIAAAREEVFAKADIIMQVRTLGANPEAGKADLALLRSGQFVIGMGDPLTPGGAAVSLAQTGAISFALELIPRISRAQSMDVLSSQANIAGYKAVLIAADLLPRMFPMLMTAAGTINAAKVLVVGAGVAGLQAIATARRLGGVVHAYDVRPAVKEQVQSLGAKFVELEIDTSQGAESSGYAKAMDEEFYRKQRELMGKVVAASNVVISTAAVPGKQAPILITKEMVQEMAPGSVIVDIAAERGGNCELTKPGETVLAFGSTIAGPLNLPASVPYHASEMYAKNLVNFLFNMSKDGSIIVDQQDEIVKDTLVTAGGQVVHPRVREILGLGSS